MIDLGDGHCEPESDQQKYVMGKVTFKEMVDQWQYQGMVEARAESELVKLLVEELILRKEVPAEVKDRALDLLNKAGLMGQG